MVEYLRTSLDLTYGALAHPIRRGIIEDLESGERRVTDLAQRYDVSLAAVSKHIRVLEDASLTHRRVRGRNHFLALDAGPLAEAAAWIGTYERFWDERLAALDRLLQERER